MKIFGSQWKIEMVDFVHQSPIDIVIAIGLKINICRTAIKFEAISPFCFPSFSFSLRQSGFVFPCVPNPKEHKKKARAFTPRMYKTSPGSKSVVVSLLFFFSSVGNLFYYRLRRFYCYSREKNYSHMK